MQIRPCPVIIGAVSVLDVEQDAFERGIEHEGPDRDADVLEPFVDDLRRLVHGILARAQSASLNLLRRDQIGETARGGNSERDEEDEREPNPSFERDGVDPVPDPGPASAGRFEPRRHRFPTLSRIRADVI
ncbi:hypothetical protein J19TS2_22030 [Cohnella xylanilytica]|nr:hypothetical protein J19TS2_22030 [Cohnella xylanilytica]